MSQRWPGGLIKPTPITPTGPYQNGSASGVWTLDQMEYWLQQGLWPIAGNVAPTAVFAGGSSGITDDNLTTAVKANINSLGNTTSFGDLSQARRRLGSCSSTSRAVFIGGTTTAQTTDAVNTIDFITYISEGNATDFGDMTEKGSYVAGCSSSTRGVFSTGNAGTGLRNTINYITIASAGNATDFGDLTVSRGPANACSSPTRGVFADGDGYNIIDYVTIASTGNATDFGDLIFSPSNDMANGAVCSSTRGVFAGGYNAGVLQNIIQYITIASTGNATDFGDLTAASGRQSSASSTTRGLFAGGISPSQTNVISYITIASVGNSIDFGDVTFTCDQAVGTSNANGGL